MRHWFRAALATSLATATAVVGIAVVPASAATSAPTPSSSGTLHPLGALVSGTTQAPILPTNSRMALPESVDLTPWAVPVGDQGSVGSCVAWAIGYGLQGWEANRAGREASIFAPMYMYSQIHVGNGDNGAYPRDGAQLLVAQGIDTQAHYTHGNYDWQTTPTTAERTNAELFQATSWTNLYDGVPGDGAITSIKSVLASQHPVALLFPIYPAFDALSVSDNHLSASEIPGTRSRGNHDVQVLGYDSTGVLIQNSWGTNWGNQGRAWLDWDFVTQYSLGAVTLGSIEPPVTQTAPSAPQSVTATRPSASTATLTWKAPPSNGGSTITGYTVSRDGKDASGRGAWSTTVSATTTSFTFSNLVATSGYTLSVRAINAIGTGAAASATVAAAPSTPSAATSVTGSATTTAATLTWAAPASNGGSAITGYRVARDGTSSTGAGAWSTTKSATSTSQTFTSLLQATTYNLSVAAVNANGAGPTTTVTVTTGGTSVPQSVKATVSGTTATLTWTPPAITGSTVTGYSVGRNGFDSKGNGPWSTTKSSTSRSQTFTNLRPGGTYVLSVAAVTGQGKGNVATVTVTIPS
ncbi:Papain family cysteine protease [Quadrisphaera granulorum]|uniref:Papain like protease n=1 Tax=Quadrisphaera granulorum TaxID=317664 RepID=A0A315ZMR1_9ACTN|nr:fibronectin type III domain-containing protein [Quadrisphaera granulorum]PWJ46433.1 papain like protease [Quadrisphaera granulorum]SZE99057.1 Papain family cysteine protease [Quadrisphaera granulorum]